MEYLTSMFWKSFIKEDKKFDGVKFEALVKRLLPLIGVKNIKQTKGSWDRSRDFENKKSAIWAECKMYSESISIRVISPTLVMAIIDRPNIIYFFSYSPLNNNAIKHLSQFQSIAGIKIIVIDDLVLETLILSNQKVIEDFFPKLEHKTILCKRPYKMLVNFSKDPEIEYYGEEVENPREKELYIYSIFSIDIFIRNLCFDKKIIGELHISQSSDKLFLLNKSIRNKNCELDVHIDKGNLFFYRFYFKALGCGELILPDFTFALKNASLPHKEQINIKSIRVSSIVKTPLIGKKYIEIVNRFKNIIQGRNKPVFINIYGESGTGKSRIISEYTEVLLEEEFNVLSFNGEDVVEVEFLTFIRKIFSRIYKLPLVLSTGELDESSISKSGFVFNLLYDTTFIVHDKISECVNYFLSGIQLNKTALLIDNLQNFDEKSLDFINEIISRLENTCSKLILIGCFNTNLIYHDTKNYDLFNRFRLKNNNDTFINEEITGFEERAYDLFLDSCIKSLEEDKEKSFSTEYPETVMFFKRYVLNRPLFIEQTLLYLEQNEAIRRIGNNFYVSNISIFNDILKTNFPKNLAALLNQRWMLIKSKYRSKSLDESVKLLCFFTKIDYNHITDNQTLMNDVVFLEKLGILKFDEKERVSFFHHQLFLYFRKNIEKYTPENYTLYLDFINKKSLTDIYFYQYFILSEKLNIVDEQILQKAINKISANFQYEDFLIPFVYSVYNILVREKKGVENNIRLFLFLRLAKILQVFKNMNARVNLLQNTRKFILENEGDFKIYGKEYVDFNHGLANAYITVYKDLQAADVLIKVIEDLDNYCFKNSNDKLHCLGKLYNRLCVVYKALNLKKDALFYGCKSLKIATKLNNNELTLKNYIDLANVYGRSIEKKASIFSLWRNAVRIYHKNKKELNSQRAMLELYEAQLYLFEGNKKGVDLLEDGVRYCEVNSVYFFGVKYLLILVLSNLCLQTDISYFKLNVYINKALDWCIRYQINRTYWKALFVKGKLYQKFGTKDVKGISELFIQSLEQFQLVITNSQTEEYNQNYLLDITCFFKNNSTTTDDSKFYEIIEALHNEEIKNQIISILKTDKNQFQLFFDSLIPKTIYNDGKFDYPIIG